MRVEVDDRSLRNFLDSFGAASDRIISRSMNKSAQQASIIGARQTSKNIGAEVTGVKKRIRNIRGTSKTLTSVIAARSTRLPVHFFNARQTKKGVTFRTKGGGRALIRSAFKQRTATGNKIKGVWRRNESAKTSGGRDYKGRTRKNRLPVRRLKAISIGESMLRREVTEPIIDRFNDRFSINISHEIQRLYR